MNNDTNITFNIANGYVRDHSILDIICPTCLQTFDGQINHDNCIGGINHWKTT